ncbi:hypothetical protein OIO90_002810 [Microbotryomycetes sp. JL221]|nr:hypothetical protein OIO90_002810 [Microbotryomycetes sp. JL221]
MHYMTGCVHLLQVAWVGLLSFNFVSAAVTPTAPGPNDVYREGGQCEAEWNRDSTGDWDSFDIDLMSGSNLQMRRVTRIASGLDGASSTTSLKFDCPDVEPNSKIYFLQFSQNGNDPQWTTRFTIAAADGSTTAPANSTQPGGQAIPWGYGTLAGQTSDEDDDGLSSSQTSAPNSAAGTTSSSTSSAANAMSTTTDDDDDQDESTTTTTTTATFASMTSSTMSIDEPSSSATSSSETSESTMASSSGTRVSAAAQTSAPSSAASSLQVVKSTVMSLAAVAVASLVVLF